MNIQFYEWIQVQNSPIDGIGFNELLSIINQNPLLITIINSDSIILYQNKIHIDLNRDDVISKPLTNFIDEQDLDKLQVLLFKVMNESQQIQTDLHFTEAGTKTLYRCLFRPLGRQNENRRIVIYSTKIDLQSSSQDENKQKLKYEYIVNHSSDGFLIVDQNLVILEMNTTSEQMLAQNKEHYIGVNFLKLIKSEDRDEITQSSKKVLSGEIIKLEKWVQRYDSKEVLLELKASKLPNNDILIILRDASENRLMQEKSENMQKQMQQVQRLESLGVLAGGIAHEFNNVLTPIIGYSELIMSELTNDDLHKSNLKQILNGAHRAKELVEQILVFSRQGDHNRTTIEIQLIIKEALKLLRASIPKMIKIVENIEKCTPVLANPAQIHQMVMNMITNSYQAIGDNSGEISISMMPKEFETDMMMGENLLPKGPYIELKIKDTGEGIDEKSIDRIFEPFFTTRADELRSGLGLSVVHGIVKNHKGHILVKSKQGEGTEFLIYFPIEKKKEDKIKVQEIQDVDGQERKILLVDDEKDVLNLFEILLTKKGYKVDKHLNSLDALEAFKIDPNSYDLLITDQTMPELTGVDLAKKIHDVRSDLPVILLTGYSQQISKENYKEFGISEFIVKPVLPSDFYDKVNKIFSE